MSHSNWPIIHNVSTKSGLSINVLQINWKESLYVTWDRAEEESGQQYGENKGLQAHIRNSKAFVNK